MAVQFKFRSSTTFDSIDIGNQSFISIRELKSKIVKKKHLNLCHDFDLVFSDSLSGQEFKDESIRIPSGSSVIIKRVPATSIPSVRPGDASAVCFDGEVNYGNIIEPTAVNVGAGSLDNFEVDLCPLPDENLPGLGKMQSTNTDKEDVIARRCNEELLVRCNELDTTYPPQRAPKDSSANDGSTLVMQSKPKTEEQTELVRTLPANHLAMERSDMPSELKCSLCRNFFKDAVMIPCCQHSFCDQCIRLALAEDAKCPMCSSTKCKAKDLLPNLSLRQAIERFLHSQLLLNGQENDLHRYAPDGESGIQVKELSYAATINKRDLPLSCFTTRRRSNQLLQNNMDDHAHLADMKCEPATLEDTTEFEGENDPQNVVRTDAEEADTCTKKDRFSVVAQGGERNFTAPSRLQRVQRTCYRCGSPDHLIRDCPIAASSQANHWNGDASVAGPTPGCAPLYWPGSPPNVGPFMNMYGGPGMMYNAAMPPVTPYVFPPYAQPMYGAYPFPSGQMNMGVGNMAVANADHCLQPSHAEVPQGRDQGQRNYNGNPQRERTGHQVHGFDAQHDYRGAHHSDDLARRSEGKHRSRNDSDEDAYSGSLRQEKRDCRNHLAEDKHEKLHRSSRVHVERRDHYGHDSKTESAKKRKMEHDKRRSGKEFHSHSRSSVEHSHSGDGARQRREESSHRYKHRKESGKSNDKEYRHDRERMTKYSDDDYGGHSHGHKRKRFH